MAKKKKKPAQSTAAPKGATTAKPFIIPSEDVGTYYINFVEIARSKHEFMMLCTRLPTKLTPTQSQTARDTGALQVDPVVQIVFPPTLINGLIGALSAQRDKYEKDHGIKLEPAAPIEVKQSDHATRH
jgi:hypothetical protein